MVHTTKHISLVCANGSGCFQFQAYKLPVAIMSCCRSRQAGSGTGFLQAFKEGTGPQNLLLNPNGGNVGIGFAVPIENAASAVGMPPF